METDEAGVASAMKAKATTTKKGCILYEGRGRYETLFGGPKPKITN
jgi:hypothetical protein